MPLASPFDFTQTATARRKILGLSLLEIPSDYSGSPTIRGGANFWPDHILQWATIYPNWYYPQMLKAQAHGANVVRLFASLDGVLLGNYSQSFLESKLLQIIADCRTLGLTLAITCSGAGGYSLIASDAIWRASYPAMLSSMFTNVLNPNADMIAYVEAGMQETLSDSTSVSLANFIATTAKSLTTIPILVSILYDNWSNYSYNNSIDVLSWHYYPNADWTLGNKLSNMKTVLKLIGSRPVLIEESNINNPVYQDKADYVEALFQAAYYHPNSAGMLLWAGQGISADGDWSLYTPPAAGTDFNPASVWPENAFSRRFAAQSTKAQNWTFNVTHTGLNVTGTVTAVPWSATLNSVRNPSEAFTLATTLKQATKASFNGSVTMAGATGSSYQISLVATDNANGNAQTVIGAPVTVQGASTTPLLMKGLIPTASDWTVSLQAQMTAGAQTTITSLAGVLAIGNIVGSAASSLGLNQPLLRRIARPVLTRPI